PAAILGLLFGSLATLRPEYDVSLGLVALAAVAWPESRPHLDLGLARRLISLTLGLSSAVGGWAVASSRAVDTPMFPIFTGNLNPTWPANGPAVEAPSLSALLGRLAETPIAGLWGLALVGATCLVVYLLVRPGEHPLLALWGLRMYLAAAVSCVVWIALLSYRRWGIGPPSAYPRFWAPVALACVLLPTALMN